MQRTHAVASGAPHYRFRTLMLGEPQTTKSEPEVTTESTQSNLGPHCTGSGCGPETRHPTNHQVLLTDGPKYLSNPLLSFRTRGYCPHQSLSHLPLSWHCGLSSSLPEPALHQQLAQVCSHHLSVKHPCMVPSMIPQATQLDPTSLSPCLNSVHTASLGDLWTEAPGKPCVTGIMG